MEQASIYKQQAAVASSSHCDRAKVVVTAHSRGVRAQVVWQADIGEPKFYRSL